MLTQENTLRTKSKYLAIEVINLYKQLTVCKNEYVLSKQILRSGTSIGANLAEGECASSEKDFLNKLYIALKNVMKQFIGWNCFMKPTILTANNTVN